MRRRERQDVRSGGIARRFHRTSASTSRYLGALTEVELVRITGFGKSVEVETLVSPPLGFAPGSATL